MKPKAYRSVLPVLVLCAGLVFAAVSVRIEEWSISSADRFPHDPDCSGVSKVGVVRVAR